MNDISLSHQRGHLKRISRRGGDSYLYRLTLGGRYFSVNFPPGTPENLLALFLAEMDSLAWEFSYRRGIGSAAAVMTWDEFERRVMEIRARLLGIDMKFEVVKIDPGSDRTLADLREWYIKIVKSEKLAKITVEYRLRALERLIRFAGEECKLGDVTREKLNDFKRWLGKTNTSGTYWMLQKLQPVLKTAHYEGFMQHYPLLGFKYPKHARAKEFLLLTMNEMFQISETFTSIPTRLAWDTCRLTGMRGSDVRLLEWKNLDFEQKIIRYRNHKMSRFEGVIMHPALLERLLAVTPGTGRIFPHKHEQSLSALFRIKIKTLKGDACEGLSYGTHTPRRSLAHYLRHTARWPKEDIRIFLGHHDQDVTDGYLMESLETIRDRMNALPFR